MAMKVQFIFFLSLILLAQQTWSAVYDCRLTSPKPSLFFEKIVKIECDLDSEAKPKFVVLAGSSKVPLNKKAEYLGQDTGKMYENHRMFSLDGQSFELHTATRMFTETAQASFFTVEPNRNSGFWVCYIEE